MKIILFILLVPYSLWLIFAYQFHFIDYLNLAFHEAGHLILLPFGRTLHFLGGTLGQLFFPVAVMIHFWREGKKFDAGVGAIWLAESMMNCAIYIADGRVMKLQLIGGIHDWNYLFTRWGLLAWAETIGTIVHLIASAILIGTLIFMFFQIKDQFSRLLPLS